jgi:hypothetical protein
VAAMPANRPTIFLSYVSEDQPFADAIADTLTNAFGRAINIKYMSNFPLGTNWRTLIDQELDSSDILLIVATGHEKLSHSFTGYEVGFFRKSQQTRKYIGEQDKRGTERLIIPFALYADIPAPVSEIEGVAITEADSFFFALDTGGKIEGKKNDPFFDLLGRIDKILEELDPSNRSAAQNQTALQNYQNEARSFYQALIKLMPLLRLRTDSPKTLLKVRLPADFSSKDVEIDNRVLLSCSGPTAGIFQQEQFDKEVPWEDFSKRIGPDDIAQNWRDALHSLTIAAIEGKFTDSDQLVFSHDETRLFRLFVSKSITFVDRTRELDIYILETLYAEDAGDPETTFLGKAIAIALRYRSLFLESDSPYGPTIRFWRKDQWKPKINQLLRELRLLTVQSHEAGLNQPGHIVDLYGHDQQAIDRVVALMGTFQSVRDSLLKSAATVMTESEPADATFGTFVKALDEFIAQTKAMNTEFLTKLIQRLELVVQ